MYFFFVFLPLNFKTYKMKRSLMILCLAGLAFLSAQSVNVPLYGDLMGGGLKSPGDPVEVFQNPGNLEIAFLRNLGDLKIGITDPYGDTVYHTMVNAVAGSLLAIDVSGWSAGAYTLTISNGQGGCLEGKFSIN